MADLRAYQPAFTGGELSPALWARVDLAKYGSGLKSALNLFIHAHGGASNRAGFEFVGEVKDSTKKTRLIPFQFNTEQSYVLEFGHLYMRVYRNGGLVLSGLSAYEAVTPYTQDDVDDLVLTQEADVMYITHVLYAPRKLSRLADDNWSLTTPTFTPTMTVPTGVAGSEYFQRKNGDSGSASFVVTAVGAGGEQSAVSSSITRTLQWGKEDGRTYKFTWNPVVGAVSYRLYRSASGDIGLLVEVTATEVTIGQFGINGVSPSPPGGADPGAPSAPTGLAFETLWGSNMRYKVAAISGSTGEESLPSAAVTLTNDLTYKGNKNTITWSPVAGAAYYVVYKESNGVYGYIGKTETTSFTDENIVADTADAPQSANNPFVGAGNYPRCSTFVEQRFALGGTLNDPQAIWMSQSANYENFGYANPRKASDALEFRIRSRQVNEVRSLLALRGMMVLTSGAEWTVTGGQADFIAPDAIVIKSQGYRGASKVQPVVVGNTVLFAQERGGVVRDFSYEFTEDSFTGKDLTILSRHLFEDREIKAWGYAQAPYSIVWVVMDDGSLRSLTYMKEHDVWAWTRHETDGVFEDVAVIGEGMEDVPYFLIKRTIGGVTKRYIERLHSRSFTNVEDAFFVDSGLTYSGAATTTISGLGHLEGKQVVALADGNVVRNLTVAGGSIALQNAAQKVHVGLPYEAMLKTLDLDLGEVRGLGTVQGRKKSVSNVTMRVERTRGIWLGTDDYTRDSGKMIEYKQRETEAWNEAIQAYTGDLAITPMPTWRDGGNVVVKQFDPLPMTILAVMPDVTLGA